MDTSKAITHLSLCSGYGGIGLGLKRVLPALRDIAHVEIEAIAAANLVAKMEQGKMDPAPVWTNLKTFPFAEFRDRVDILSGGYPCQPFSCAGLRRGKDDPRHLWPYIAEGITAARPRLVFFENVEGHLSEGFCEVQESLRSLGYRVEAGIFSAAEVGAPHQRKRLFILGVKHGVNLAELAIGIGCGGRKSGGKSRVERCGGEFKLDSSNQEFISDGTKWPARPNQPQHPWEQPRTIIKSESIYRLLSRIAQEHPQCLSEREHQKITYYEYQRDMQTQSTLGGTTHGFARLGNGVVPDTAEKAFRTLTEKIK